MGWVRFKGSSGRPFLVRAELVVAVDSGADDSELRRVFLAPESGLVRSIDVVDTYEDIEPALITAVCAQPNEIATPGGNVIFYGPKEDARKDDELERRVKSFVGGNT